MCTFENQPELERCEMCGSLRDADSSAALMMLRYASPNPADGRMRMTRQHKD